MADQSKTLDKQMERAEIPGALLQVSRVALGRKRALEALRDGEEQWRAVFEHNPRATEPIGRSRIDHIDAMLDRAADRLD
jgi:hypothetical protein